MKITAESKHELLSHIKHSFENPIRLSINHNNNLDKVGICNVLYLKLIEEHEFDILTMEDLLINLGIERKSFREPGYWFNSYEERKEAIDECWDKWITSTQYEEWQNRLLTENKK